MTDETNETETTPNDSDWSKSDFTCSCGSHDVKFRLVESSCGGYDDYQYRCQDCGRGWWAEGSDA